MDTVLGLSLTRTRVGWVLVDGHDADGAALDHGEFAVRRTRGVRAVHTAEQATAAVLRTRAAVRARGHRVHTVAVTWSGDAAAEAALLLEFLTNAGLDHVVPVRWGCAAEALARGIGPVIGSTSPAVCLLDGDSATVAIAGGTQTAVRPAVGDGVLRWLTTVCGRAGRRPDGLVIAGSGANLDVLARRLENTLGIPVLVQAGAQVASARGAALASEFADADVIEAAPGDAPERARPLTYAGGVAMLVAGAVTFVVSLSLAVGLHLAPDRGSADRAGHASTTPPVARAAPPRGEKHPASLDEPAELPTSPGTPDAGPDAAP